MSVLRIPVHVMKMLNAPTVMVLTAVLVNRDSQETEKHVKVLCWVSRVPKRNEAKYRASQ